MIDWNGILQGTVIALIFFGIMGLMMYFMNELDND